MWLVVLPVFLPPACCYPSSVPELRVISTERMGHLFLIFLPKENTFFLMNMLWGSMFFKFCRDAKHAISLGRALCRLALPCSHPIILLVILFQSYWLLSVSRIYQALPYQSIFALCQKYCSLTFFLRVSSQAMSSVKSQLFRKDVSHQLLPVLLWHCILFIWNTDLIRSFSCFTPCCSCDNVEL